MNTIVATEYQSRSSPVVSRSRQSAASTVPCSLRLADRMARPSCWSEIIRVRSAWRGAVMRKRLEIPCAYWTIFARISSSPGCVLPPSRIGRPGSIPSRSKTARGIRGGARFSGSNSMPPTGNIRAGSDPTIPNAERLPVPARRSNRAFGNMA